jgi:hypothetical protein
MQQGDVGSEGGGLEEIEEAREVFGGKGASGVEVCVAGGRPTLEGLHGQQLGRLREDEEVV